MTKGRPPHSGIQPKISFLLLLILVQLRKMSIPVLGMFEAVKGEIMDKYGPVYQLCAYIFVIMSFPPHMFVNS